MNGRAGWLALALAGGIPGLLLAQKLPSEALLREAAQLPAAMQAAEAPALKTYMGEVQKKLAAAGAQGEAAKAAATDAANAVRVARAIQEHKATYPLSALPFTYHVVPAMSDVQRLPDVFPEDGVLAGSLQIVAAKDEYEPASFVVFPFQNMDKVEFAVSPLAGPNGAVLPKDALDLKVVKVWYQNINAWYSYFDDSGLTLVPELLLNDENLVKVDTAAKANYARVDYPAGSKYVWISPPKHLETKEFRPAEEPFADAKTLQPVALKAGEFKQFFLTARIPKEAAAGTYRGSVAVSAGGRKLADMPVAVRVLPFVLPAPTTFFDIDRDFVVAVMGTASIGAFRDMNGGDLALAKAQRLAVLKDMRAHGIYHPSGIDQDVETVALAKSLGFSTRPWFGTSFAPWFGYNFGGRMTFDNMMAAKAAAKKCQEFNTALIGHTDLLLSHGDEQGAAFVACHRNMYKYWTEFGAKVGCAGHDALLYKGGYIYGTHPFGGFPDEGDKPRPWNIIGDKYTGFYAGQHTGSENPAYARRQNGLLSYLSNCSMLYNYEFAYGSWNDRANEVYKPMVQAYMSHDGLVDTLQWEGFREGVDDMRYATLLMKLAREAINSGNLDRAVEGRKARQYMALLDGRRTDLNAARAEMANYILKLSVAR